MEEFDEFIGDTWEQESEVESDILADQERHLEATLCEVRAAHRSRKGFMRERWQKQRNEWLGNRLMTYVHGDGDSCKKKETPTHSTRLEPDGGNSKFASIVPLIDSSQMTPGMRKILVRAQKFLFPGKPTEFLQSPK
jgi:hypothetical protein